jgi:hypothetical protein
MPLREDASRLPFAYRGALGPLTRGVLQSGQKVTMSEYLFPQFVQVCSAIAAIISTTGPRSRGDRVRVDSGLKG